MPRPGSDWWPVAIGWAAEGGVPQRPAAVVRPTTTEQVAATLAACDVARVPVTAAAGRSGVCGGSVPVHGGIALDLTGLEGVVRVDETSLTADVRAGTFGPDLEVALGKVGDGYTLGHWPQSMDLSTVGGWLACRGAGQYSTRYGKIEDMVIGLEVVLADGRVVHTEGRARAPPPGRTSPSSSSAARARSASSPRHGCAFTRSRPRRSATRSVSARSPAASRRAAASCAGAQRRPCCASTTRSSRSGTSSSGTPTSSSCSTRPIPTSWPPR